MTDRKDLLLSEVPSDRELSQEEEQRLRKAADKGGMYLTLASSPGWRNLLEEFINIRLAQERYFEAKTEDLADIRAAQKELIDLLRFVKTAIADGEKAYRQLRK